MCTAHAHTAHSFIFIHKLFTYITPQHNTTHSLCVRARESGRVPFSHFNQNACLTYRCQTSLVLITNITKVFAAPNSASYLMSLYYTHSITLPACVYLFPYSNFFPLTFPSTSLLGWGKVLKASVYLRHVMPWLQYVVPYRIY